MEDTTLDRLCSNYDYFILDCDGTLWENKSIIPGTIEALHYLDSESKKIFILSNNSYYSVKNMHEKCNTLYNLSIPLSHCYNSALLAAEYIKEKHSSLKLYTIGGPGITEELTKASVSHIEASSTPTSLSTSDFPSLSIPECSGVVVGIDPLFNYYKLTIALNLIKRGATFFSTNKDAALEFKGLKMPGAGSVVAPIEATAGVQSICIGKPSPYALELIMQNHSIPHDDKHKFIMIGDRVQTDIAFAYNANIKSCLVFSGVTSREQLPDILSSAGYAPDYLMDKLATFS
jgi:phosphoglycolate/pyridoxal phosphate phosphatase family enzyme